MTNLESILKSRDFPLLTKVCLVKTVKTVVFPVVMYGCKSWIMKKTVRQKTDAFKLQCWRRLLRVTWTAKRSNQSILKEINPEYSLELGLTLLNCPTLKSYMTVEVCHSFSSKEQASFNFVTAVHPQ